MRDRLDPDAYGGLVRRALAEDLGSGDITSNAIVPADRQARGVFLARAPLVVAGLDVVREVFRQVNDAVRFDTAVSDGDVVPSGATIATASGSGRALLAAERTALNFLQYLSGIATTTRTFVDAAGPSIRILDTRKTTPGFRTLAKYAVRAGGGTNHRTGLFDGILIKDNHIRVAGGVRRAVELVRAAHAAKAIEVEAQSLADVDEAVAAGAHVVMLDNMDDAMTREAVGRIAGRARVELSGNMTVPRVRALAASGADDVSVGALTHSAGAADISFEIDL